MTFPDPPPDWFDQRHRELLPKVRALIADLEARRLRAAWQRKTAPKAKG